MSTENQPSAGSNGSTVEFLESRLTDNPDSMLFARLADCYLEADRSADAIRICEDGIKKHPYYATGHFILGKSYLAAKMFEQAEKEFKRVLLFDPKFLAAHKMYGDLMREIGWENTCEMSYRKILQIDPLDKSAQKMVAKAAGSSSAPPVDATSIGPDGPHDQPVEALAKEPAESNAAPEEVKVFDETLGPIGVSSDQEKMFFEEGDPLSAQPAEQDAAAKEPSDEALDDKKAEEFSYILDDIFKDENGDEQAESEASAADAMPDSPGAVTGPLAEVNVATSVEVEEAKQVTLVDDFGPAKPQRSQVETPATSVERPAEDLPVVPVATAEPVMVKAGKNKGDKIVTPTLGEIYAAQGQYNKAIDVFETLIKKNPENEFYSKKLELLKQKLNESEN